MEASKYGMNDLTLTVLKVGSYTTTQVRLLKRRRLLTQ